MTTAVQRSFVSSASVSSAPQPGLGRIIFASAAGTMIEWYDFYIFGSLATVISSKFYQTGTPLGDLIAWLSAFAVGFIVRPFGAVVFGRVGDLVGRKYTFLITMTLMGTCTFLVGVLPTADVIGPVAGIILVVLRLLQGLALGGEYGGAATYVAEHSPNDRRGFMTSWIQITATLGLFVSLAVIQITRFAVGEENFKEFGWRIPFLISIFLIVISLWIRFSLRESPLYVKLKEKKQVSKNPIVESFGNPLNLRYVLLALFGATMGQGVVWYTGQFYALFYLQKIFGVDLVTSNFIVGAALLAATPLFVVMGHLSDKYGRKPFLIGGMALAAVTYLPIYWLMSQFAPYIGDPANKIANPNYSPIALAVLVFIQVVYVTMVYGPIAAFLVELFPTKIRYTSMSLPYHIGNGVFGGLVPVIGLSLIQATGNNYAGLWYPIAVATVSAVIGLLRIPETSRVDLASDQSIAVIRAGKAAPINRRILVPLDGSSTSEAVLEHVKRLAKTENAEVVLLHVISASEEVFQDPALAAAEVEAIASEERAYLDRLVNQLSKENITVSAEVRRGPVAETIVATAKELGADLIAMCTHGHGGFKKLVMGSVTEWVIQHAPVPVMAFRPQPQPAS